MLTREFFVELYGIALLFAVGIAWISISDWEIFA